MRLRPVLVTVLALVIALVPLALPGRCGADVLAHRWAGCSAQPYITLLLVPVIYSIFVLDLKLIKWKRRSIRTATVQQPEASGRS